MMRWFRRLWRHPAPPVYNITINSPLDPAAAGAAIRKALDAHDRRMGR